MLSSYRAVSCARRRTHSSTISYCLISLHRLITAIASTMSLMCRHMKQNLAIEFSASKDFWRIGGVSVTSTEELSFTASESCSTGNARYWIKSARCMPVAWSFIGIKNEEFDTSGGPEEPKRLSKPLRGRQAMASARIANGATPTLRRAVSTA